MRIFKGQMIVYRVSTQYTKTLKDNMS